MKIKEDIVNGILSLKKVGLSFYFIQIRRLVISNIRTFMVYMKMEI
jgi:hypothetical protein